MPDPLVTPKEKTETPPGFPDVEKHNKEVADKLASQDIMGHSTVPDPNADAGSELDKLAKAAEEASKTPEPEEVTPPPPEQKEPTPEEKVKAEAEAAAKDEQQKKADELFKNEPTLPPNASPKSSEAFSAIKLRAAQEISAREAELEKLRKDKAELEEKLKNQAPPEALKELEEHRQWRAKIDVEADPKFKEFDRQVSSAQEFIYAQLLKSPAITKDVIAEIKKHGGPEMVKMDKIFTAINDPMLQRLVESKLSDIEMAKFNKSQAISAAKENIQSYLQERSQQFSQQAVQHTQATEKFLNRNLSALSWFKPQEIPSGADEATKKAIEGDNKFLAELKPEISAALKDDSAEMRATLITGVAQLFRLQRAHKALETEHASVKKQLAEVTEKLERIKKASLGRVREGGAAPGATVKVKNDVQDLVNKPATQAVDDLMKQVMEERERAKAGGQ